MPGRVTAFTEDHGASTSWTITNQGGFQDGDVLLMPLVTNSDHGISSGPAGFTQVGTTQTDAGTDSSMSLFVKVADDEPPDWAVTFLASELGTSGVVVYRGVNAAHVIAGSTDWIAQASSTGATQTGPTVTPDEDYSIIVQFVGTDPNGAYTGEPDTSPAAEEVIDHIFNADAYLFVQDYLLPAAGPLALDATISSSDNFARFQVALAPGPVTIEPRLSGGEDNADPLLSFGGPVSSELAPVSLFPNVERETADVGFVFYALVYYLNTDVARDASLIAWIDPQLAGMVEVAVGAAVEAAGEEVVGPVDRLTAPAGVDFVTPGDVDHPDAVNLGVTPAGAAVGLWYRLTGEEVAAAQMGASARVRVQVTTL